MKILRVGICFLLFLALSVTAFALNIQETTALVDDDLSRDLLAKEFIFAETGGTVPVGIQSAISILQQPSFLTCVQEEYVKMLPPGQLPEFVIQQSASNTWFFINGHQERTDITEVAGRLTGQETFDLAYYTEGRRFFGFYQALIHIRLAGNGDSTGYTVAVYAYPENGFCRFFFRHLNLVDKYFRSKTGEISALAVRIGTRLCRPERMDAVAKCGF